MKNPGFLFMWPNLNALFLFVIPMLIISSSFSYCCPLLKSKTSALSPLVLAGLFLHTYVCNWCRFPVIPYIYQETIIFWFEGEVYSILLIICIGLKSIKQEEQHWTLYKECYLLSIMLYWENNAYMYWVKEQLCIKLLVAEAAYAASAYLSSVLL